MNRFKLMLPVRSNGSSLEEKNMLLIWKKDAVFKGQNNILSHFSRYRNYAVTDTPTETDTEHYYCGISECQYLKTFVTTAISEIRFNMHFNIHLDIILLEEHTTPETSRNKLK